MYFVIAEILAKFGVKHLPINKSICDMQNNEHTNTIHNPTGLVAVFKHNLIFQLVKRSCGVRTLYV